MSLSLVEIRVEKCLLEFCTDIIERDILEPSLILIEIVFCLYGWRMGDNSCIEMHGRM